MACLSDSHPTIEGHRGFRARWPENTLPGFLAALRLGVDAIELDAGLSRDGVVVICHDAALDPDLTRDAAGRWIESPGPPLLQMTLSELRHFDIGRARPGGPTARAFPRQQPVDGARVPTLAEVFEAASDFAAQIDVELKTDPTAADRSPDPQAFVEAVVAVAETYGARSRLALRSFDWRCLDHAARRWPDVKLTWLSDAITDAERGLWRAEHQDAVPDSLFAVPNAFWAPDHRRLTRQQVARARQAGVAVVPWTVNEPALLTRLLAWGVNGICTDDPEMARAVIYGAT